jgi:hypothetical protein
MREPILPEPIARYIQASNTFNLDLLVASFADDALVNDQRRDFWGVAAIRKWASREIIDDKVTMRVTKVAEHYGGVIVTADMDGNYDKKDLPDPLALTFYFSVRENKITQLIILHNQAAL